MADLVRGGIRGSQLPFSGAMNPGIAILCCCVALWIGAGTPASGENASLDIKYDNSEIEIEATALGFFPARLRFEKFSADVVVNVDTLALTDAVFEFEYDTITSESKGRDRKVRRWLEAEVYPHGRFALRRVETVGEERVAVGDLTLHGQTGEARFHFSLEREGELVSLRGEAVIDYREWGLPILRVLFFNIQPELTISIRIVGALG